MEDDEDRVAKIDAVDLEQDSTDDEEDILPTALAQKNAQRDENETGRSDELENIHIRLFARIRDLFYFVESPLIY